MTIGPRRGSTGVLVRCSSAAGRWALFVLGALAGAAALADDFTLAWSSVDGGGIMFSTGGDFRVGATIGQADAGAPLTGGEFAVVGGFWAGAIPSPPRCPGDTDDDRDVDQDDIDAVLFNYGSTVPPWSNGDLDGDGDVDQDDIDTVLFYFGTGC